MFKERAVVGVENPGMVFIGHQRTRQRASVSFLRTHRPPSFTEKSACKHRDIPLSRSCSLLSQVHS